MQYARWSVRSDGRVSSCTRMQLHRGGNDWSTTRSIVRLCRWSLKFKLAGKQNFICLADYSSIMIFLYPIFPHPEHTLKIFFFFRKIIPASLPRNTIYFDQFFFFFFFFFFFIFFFNFFFFFVFFFFIFSFVINLLFKFHLFVGFAVQSWIFSCDIFRSNIHSQIFFKSNVFKSNITF